MSKFDEYRPPGSDRFPRGGAKRRRKNTGTSHGRGGPGRGDHGRGGAGAQDGSREARMAEDFEFSSYYGKPVVKAPPWEWPIAVYFWLGGVAGGSALLAAGAQATGNTVLRRNSRLAAFTAAAVGSGFLILDLGRPERFYNMFRVFKASSPMNMGSWLLGGFSGAAALSAAAEVADIAEGRVKLPGIVHKVLHTAQGPAGVVSAVLAGPLAGYTAVLLADTSNPTWNGSKQYLPYLFVSSASLASGGLAMVTTPATAASPARALAVMGVAGDIASLKALEKTMEPEHFHHYNHGTPGKFMHWAEYLAVVGGIGTIVATVSNAVAAHTQPRNRRSRLALDEITRAGFPLGRLVARTGTRSVARPVARPVTRALSVLSGAALLSASALTRFGVLEAGLHAAKDPAATIGPQKRRAAQRLREQGTAHSVVTGPRSWSAQATAP